MRYYTVIGSSFTGGWMLLHLRVDDGNVLSRDRRWIPACLVGLLREKRTCMSIVDCRLRPHSCPSLLCFASLRFGRNRVARREEKRRDETIVVLFF